MERDGQLHMSHLRAGFCFVLDNRGIWFGLLVRFALLA
jgi:hypothetical protein